MLYLLFFICVWRSTSLSHGNSHTKGKSLNISATVLARRGVTGPFPSSTCISPFYISLYIYFPLVHLLNFSIIYLKGGYGTSVRSSPSPAREWHVPPRILQNRINYLTIFGHRNYMVLGSQVPRKSHKIPSQIACFFAIAFSHQKKQKTYRNTPIQTLKIELSLMRDTYFH